MSGQITKLSQPDLLERLGQHPNWTLDGDKIRLELEFADFPSAFGFMSSVAIVAEKNDHHPEWSNVYNRVTIELTTHDVGGISERDFALAEQIDRLASAGRPTKR